MSDEPERNMSSVMDPDGAGQESKSKPGAKPRASRAGTRSVSTLNAEQLARKRANDREAQRAIRQRTREHIERLENRIKELSQNNPDSDGALEAMQRRNSELEEELRQLRRTLFGMGEGSSSPSGSSQIRGFVPNPGPNIGAVGYPQSQWPAQNPNVTSMGYAPTSNPMPEADPSWQPPPGHSHDPRRNNNPQQHHHPGFPQQVSWSRTDSSDSDYDSGYTLEHDTVPHPVGVYPGHIQEYVIQHQHGGRQADGMWQTPTSSSGVSTPYEAQAQLPNMRQSRDEHNTHGMRHSLHHQTGTPEWGLPPPQGSEHEAYF